MRDVWVALLRILYAPRWSFMETLMIVVGGNALREGQWWTVGIAAAFIAIYPWCWRNVRDGK
jgi:hypothetical protein